MKKIYVISVLCIMNATDILASDLPKTPHESPANHPLVPVNSQVASPKRQTSSPLVPMLEFPMQPAQTTEDEAVRIAREERLRAELTPILRWNESSTPSTEEIEALQTNSFEALERRAKTYIRYCLAIKNSNPTADTLPTTEEMERDLKAVDLAGLTLRRLQEAYVPLFALNTQVPEVKRQTDHNESDHSSDEHDA